MKKNFRTFTILKWIPRLLMLGLIGFSTYVYFNYSQTQKQEKKTTARRETRRVVGQMSNIQYTHFDEGKRVYHVNADRQKQLKSNAQRLENPEFIFYDKNQKEAIWVTGKYCSISKDMSSIIVSDDTEVRSYTGMTVNAKYMKYDSDAREFNTGAPARFDWKTMKGKAKGFVYKIDSETLILPADPEIHYINEGGANKAPIVMQGKKGFIDRQNGFAYMENDVVVTQGVDRIVADRIEANFKPGDNNLQKITAIGQVHVKFGRPNKGDAAPQAAQPAQVADATQTPQISNVFATEETSGKELDAAVVELYFLEDGRTIKSFHSTGDCVFVLHTFDEQNRPKENRIIKGDEFDATFNKIGEMEQFHAKENVSVNLRPAGPPKKQDPTSAQTIFCKDLVTDFVPDTGDVKEIHFNDGFKHVQNKRTVSSDRAVYTAVAKKTDLIGNPEIQDATFNITADGMELFEENNGIRAKGNVKSSFIRGEGNNPTTFPFSSPSNQPVYISSETMDWDSQKSEAVYQGKSKLWQEKNVITADKMVINDRDHTLSAYEKVHTIFYNGQDKKTEEKPKKGAKAVKPQTQTAQTQSAPKVAQAQSQSQPQTKEDPLNPFSGSSESQDGPISVDAGIMNYVEKDRIIHFEKEVKIVTPSTKINSEKADFHLKDNSSDFDRLYALGNVNIQHEQKKGTGKQATFFSDEKKLILEGTPKLTEAGKADIFGHVLTLFLTDGRILIDGQDDGRASTTLQMEGGAIKPVPPSKLPKKNAPNAGSKDRKPNQNVQGSSGSPQR
jgi:LPS export ABC transporter protein LptC/lipopolysaccharide transport protein LptA